MGHCVEAVAVDERSLRIQRRFDLPMIVAALLVIPLLVIEESGFGEPSSGSARSSTGGRGSRSSSSSW